jgi:leucyl/phenylalanyl-tRNA--protein transferase
MFTRVPDASKIALAGLVAFCRHHGIEVIDCQQNTQHPGVPGCARNRSSRLCGASRTNAKTIAALAVRPVYWNALASPKPPA